ncbi:hypothetical protein M3Y96_01180100 [Aphelenchoides besseyi]|nr:hypothetical protein M3Y96_01180100 [Aphelenchoides besseyi]
MMIDPFFRSNKTFRAPDPPTPEHLKHNKEAPNPPMVVDFSKPVFLQSSPIPNRHTKRITPISVPNNNEMHNANTVLLNKMSTPKKEVAHQRPTLSPPPVPPANISATTVTSNTCNGKLTFQIPTPPLLPSGLLKTTPIISDERSGLMAAIRAAGGSENAKLKKVSKTVDEKKPIHHHKFGLSTTTVFTSIVKTKTTNNRDDFMTSLTKMLKPRVLLTNRQNVEKTR